MIFPSFFSKQGSSEIVEEGAQATQWSSSSQRAPLYAFPYIHAAATGPVRNCVTSSRKKPGTGWHVFHHHHHHPKHSAQAKLQHPRLAHMKKSFLYMWPGFVDLFRCQRSFLFWRKISLICRFSVKFVSFVFGCVSFSKGSQSFVIFSNLSSSKKSKQIKDKTWFPRFQSTSSREPL